MVSAKHGYKKTKLLIQEVEDDDSEEDSEEVYFVVRSKVRGVSASTNSVRFNVQLVQTILWCLYSCCLSASSHELITTFLEKGLEYTLLCLITWY